jgi:hypothetical protein
MSWRSSRRLARTLGAWAVIAMLGLQLAARFSATQRLDSLEARAAAAWCGTPGGPSTIAANPFGVKFPPVRDGVGNP